MKYHYDWAAEMVKIAESAEHLNSMEKLAFSREGKEEVSEVEEEMKKLASDDCDCKEDCDDCDCDCHDKSEKKEASVSLEDTAGLLLEISTELEDQGMDRLAAATIVLADNILKTAAAKKSPSSSSSSSSSSKSSDKKSDKKSGKKMTMKERMEKMRAMQKGKKGKSKDKSEDKSSKKK